MAAKKDGEGQQGGNGAAANGKTKRSRWATRKLTVKSSGLKRLSIMHRKHGTASEKKRASGGSESLRQNGEGDAEDSASQKSGDGHTGPRRLFFNIPLPEDLVDESGNPTQTFTRNKIRTAKYTPLSFVPKNLWFQFQNIANVFFLFLVILAVSLETSASCPFICLRVFSARYFPYSGW